MKYLSLKPSLKLVFMTCITAILISPKALLAQNNGDVNIEFHGRDTMVNGVNMKFLPAKDRKAVRTQIAVLNRISSAPSKTGGDLNDSNTLSNNDALHKTATPHDSVLHSASNNINTGGGVPVQTTASSAVAPAAVSQSAAPSAIVPASIPLTTIPLAVATPAAAPPSVTPSTVVPASVLQAAAPAAVASVPQNGGAQVAVSPVTAASTPVAALTPVAVTAARELVRNTQTFDYTITSKEGISTRVSYYVSEPIQSDAKQIIGAYKPGLEIQDVSLVPQFWAGKTLLTFSLPDKTAAEVELTDNEGKPIWEDRIVSPIFSKSFSWTLNGTYYLVVKQGGETAIKKIVKE
ncbi:MAG: type sorting protein [Mucilaginibacter sp.]|jgi:hypothetical protein|nr:type sorting protein [Mucilaginibacter sp.]